MPEQSYFSAVDDGLGYLWICSNHGIYKASKTELYEIMIGKRRATKPANFGRSEGMSTAQCNGASQPAGWRTRYGRLLFPTARGLAVV